MNTGTWFDGWATPFLFSQTTTTSPLGSPSFGLSTFPSRNPILQYNSLREECVFLYWMEPGTSLRGQIAKPHPQRGANSSNFASHAIVPKSHCEVLAEGGERSGCGHNTLRLGPAALPTRSNVFKISWSKAEDLGWPPNILLVWNWKNEEISFAIGILLSSTVFQDKCTFMLVFDFIFSFAIIYFKILSQVSPKRTRARMFGNLTDDI